MPENDNKVAFFIKQSWLLMISALFFGLVLSCLNAAWEPRIIQNEIDKFNRLAGELLLGAENFEVALEKAEIKTPKGKIATTDIKRGVDAEGNTIGWAFACQGPGFADKIKLVLTVDSKFEKLVGFGVLFSNETPNFGDKIKNDYYKNQFIGAPTEEFILKKTGNDKVIDNEIIAISGATITSEAVVKIFNTYIGQVKEQLKNEGLIE